MGFIAPAGAGASNNTSADVRSNSLVAAHTFASPNGSFHDSGFGP